MSVARPPYLLADGKTISQAWINRYRFQILGEDGKPAYTYVPSPKQVDFHESMVPNCILEGTRGTGKSLAIRNDAHMRSLAHPGHVYLIIRRTMGELKKTHIKFIKSEMEKIGGRFNSSDAIAYYPEVDGKQSIGFYGSCDTEDEMMKLLGGEYHTIYFDEITTFTSEQITKIGTCARVPEELGLMARIRGGTNPIGVGAEYIHKYYITKDVPPEEDPDYIPGDYEAIHTTLADNKHISEEAYRKRFAGLPEHIRRAWLDGEWVVEGAYFNDFRPTLNGESWHVIHELPQINGEPMLQCPWLMVYRVLDWGFSPDPAVCLWIGVLPNGRAIAFKEADWLMTPASQVAIQIERRSAGLRVVQTYADPTVFLNQQATELNSIGDIFADNGVQLTKSRNDRASIGFAIHEWLNTLLEDGKPKLQIYAPPHPPPGYGCTKLAKTIPLMRVEKNHPERIANGNDHWVIGLGYFCQGQIGSSSEPGNPTTIPWWMNLASNRAVLGSESVRR